MCICKGGRKAAAFVFFDLIRVTGDEIQDGTICGYTALHLDKLSQQVPRFSEQKPITRVQCHMYLLMQHIISHHR